MTNSEKFEKVFNRPFISIMSFGEFMCKEYTETTKEKYDYREAMKADIMQYIEDNSIDKEDYNNKDHMLECLSDDLWIEDSVTGNASGSYTFSRWQAEENLCHNFDLISEAYEEFGCQPDFSNPEAIDVTIRCYLLNQVLWDICSELWEEE